MSNAAPQSIQPSQEPARQESRTIYEPFFGKDVQISDRITDRLRGRYAQGPTMPNGEPEFGWREFDTPPIQHEAAALITAMAVEHAVMTAALRLAIKAGSLLLQNSIGCATNHYGNDHEIHGLPGWLIDTEKQLIEASAALPQSSGVARANQERGE